MQLFKGRKSNTYINIYSLINILFFMYNPISDAEKRYIKMFRSCRTDESNKCLKYYCKCKRLL